MLGKMLQSKNMTILDANAILRYLIKDIEEQEGKVNEILNINSIDLYITTETIAEVVYVLKNTYKRNNKTISAILIKFINIKNVNVFSLKIIIQALLYYSDEKLDFVDCMLASYKKELGYNIFTFDKKLNSLLATIDSL